LGEVIETINKDEETTTVAPLLEKRFHQLDGWIIRRLWSHRTKRWRNAAWSEYPIKRLRTEFKLVSLVSLIPSLQIAKALS
jgi:RNA-directed DNA polymerase